MNGRHEGDQLELALDDVRLRSSGRPWGGRSPRELTSAYKRFILQPRAEKSVSDFVSDENQLDLWLAIKKAPRVLLYRGAPSLLPLPRGGLKNG